MRVYGHWLIICNKSLLLILKNQSQEESLEQIWLIMSMHLISYKNLRKHWPIQEASIKLIISFLISEDYSESFYYFSSF